MKKPTSRPVFQGVLKYRYPATAIASVLHRISGVILFLLIPVLIWALDKSLASAEGFQTVQSILATPIALTLLWITIASLLYHLFAGIRHVLMDAGVGEKTIKAGKIGAYIVFIATIVALLLIGVWL